MTSATHRSESAARDLVVIASAFAIVSALYWAAVLLACGRGGLPLDDAYIHLQFARNLLRDGQMAFNRGVPSSGCTAPAYPPMLAGAYLFVGDWALAGFVLNAALSVACAIAVYGVMRTWTGRADLARWAGLLTVLSNPTVIQAYGGMESAGYCLVFLLGLWAYGSQRRRLLGSALLAAGVWLRPEFALFAPLIAIERAVAARRDTDRPLRRWLRECSGHAVIWLVVLSAYAAFHWNLDRHLLPSTFHAKSLIRGPWKHGLFGSLPAAISSGSWWQALPAATLWPALILLSAGVGIAVNCAPLAFGLREAIPAQWRDDGPASAARRLAVLTLIATPFVRGMFDPTGVFWFHFQRYFAHFTPLAALIVIGALPVTGAVVQRRCWDWSRVPLDSQWRRTLGWAAVGCAGMGAAAVVAVSNVNHMQVAVAERLRDEAPPAAVIATNDIGAIGFITDRPVLDTVGLVEPALVRHYRAGGVLADYLAARRPNYVAIFPGWYPDLAARADLLEPLWTVRLTFNIICGGDEMVVYRGRSAVDSRR